MSYDYRYLPKKDKFFSFLLVLISFFVILLGVWGIIIYSHYNDIGVGVFIGVLIVIFIMVGVIWNKNEKYIKLKCIWDSVSINKEKLTSSRYGIIPIKNIKSVRVNDISKVYSFCILTEARKYKFACLSFLGSEGGSEYRMDKDALKAIASEIILLANNPESKIKIWSESTSNVLFYLSCLVMLLLIPGFIYAPQRMIFVSSFVVPVFIILLVKRRKEKCK